MFDILAIGGALLNGSLHSISEHIKIMIDCY